MLGGVDWGKVQKKTKGNRGNDVGSMKIRDGRGWDVEPAKGSTLEVGKTSWQNLMTS